MMILQVSLVIAAYALVGAIATETNCTSEFNSALELALEIKEKCNIKGYYDCCEVCHHDARYSSVRS